MSDEFTVSADEKRAVIEDDRRRREAARAVAAAAEASRLAEIASLRQRMQQIPSMNRAELLAADPEYQTQNLRARSMSIDTLRDSLRARAIRKIERLSQPPRERTVHQTPSGVPLAWLS